MEVSTRRPRKLPPVQQSLRDFCRDIAPEDTLDAKARMGANLSAPEKEVLRGRREKCIRGALRISEWLLGEHPATEEFEAIEASPYAAALVPVRAWLEAGADHKVDRKKIAEETLIAAGLAELRQAAVAGETKIVFWRLDGGDNMRKCAYAALKAFASDYPSDACSWMFDAAMCAARHYERTEFVAGGTSHTFLKGLISG